MSKARDSIQANTEWLTPDHHLHHSLNTPPLGANETIRRLRIVMKTKIET